MGDFAKLDLLFRESQAPGGFGRGITLVALSAGRCKPCSGLVEQCLPLSGPEEAHPFVEVSCSHSALLLRAVEEQPRKEEE